MQYAINKDADQPAHLRSLISAFIVRCLDSIIHILAKSKISQLWIVSLAEQAGFSLTWSQTPKTGFLVNWLKCIGTEKQIKCEFDDNLGKIFHISL